MGRLKGLRTLLLGGAALAGFLYLYSLLTQPAPLPAPRDVYRRSPSQPLGIYEPVRVIDAEESPLAYSLSLIDATDATFVITCDRLREDTFTLRSEPLNEDGIREAVIQDLAPGSLEQEACFGLLIRLDEGDPGARITYPALLRMLVVLESRFQHYLVRELYRAEPLSALLLNEPVTRLQIAVAHPTYGISIRDESDQTLDACVSFADGPPRFFLDTQIPDPSRGWESDLDGRPAAALYAVLIRWDRTHDDPRTHELLRRLDRAFAIKHAD